MSWRKLLLLSLTIAVIAIVFTVIVRPLVIPVYRVSPPTTHASYDWGALVIDREWANRILDRIGLSIDDIVDGEGKVYYLLQLVPMGYIVNGTFYEYNDTIVANYISKLDLSEYKVVLKPLENRIIIVIGDDQLELKPLQGKPEVLVYDPWTGEYVDNMRTYYPFEIYDVDGARTFIVIEIMDNVSVSDLDSQRNELISRFQEDIRDNEEFIKKYGDKPFWEYWGPRESGEIIYVNDWPVLHIPLHDVCSDMGTYRICATMCSILATYYENIHIVI